MKETCADCTWMKNRVRLTGNIVNYVFTYPEFETGTMIQVPYTGRNHMAIEDALCQCVKGHHVNEDTLETRIFSFKYFKMKGPYMVWRINAQICPDRDFEE